MSGSHCPHFTCPCNGPCQLDERADLERKVAELHSRNDRQEAEIHRLRRNMSANQKYTPQAIEKIAQLEYELEGALGQTRAARERYRVVSIESKENLKAFNDLRDDLRTLLESLHLAEWPNDRLTKSWIAH